MTDSLVATVGVFNFFLALFSAMLIVLGIVRKNYFIKGIGDLIFVIVSLIGFGCSTYHGESFFMGFWVVLGLLYYSAMFANFDRHKFEKLIKEHEDNHKPE
jgi:hypothetical protein